MPQQIIKAAVCDVQNTTHAVMELHIPQFAQTDIEVEQYYPVNVVSVTPNLSVLW